MIELPRPTANDCAKCHDGKQAFSVLVACTKCHAPPTQPFEVARPDKRFVHGGHHDVTTCATCHVLDPKTGETTIAGHTACTPCHAEDFGARWPDKCAACHAATEPWRKLRADAKPVAITELGVSLDHTKHDRACTSCHTLTTATVQLRPARGHASCVGAGCHAATSGASPHLADCVACHTLGLAKQRAENAAKSPWSVRTSFDHAPHKTTECTACHTSVAGAYLAMPTPAKATCAPCHDSVKAFGLVGTTCRRCHL